MDNIEDAHNGRAVVGDCLLAIGVDQEQVTSVRTKCGFYGVLDCEAGVDIGENLSFALGRIGACKQLVKKFGKLSRGWRAFFEDNDGRCLSSERCHDCVAESSRSRLAGEYRVSLNIGLARSEIFRRIQKCQASNPP